MLDQDILLPADVAHHAKRVLRLRDGEALIVFNGDGMDYHGSLLDLSGKPGARLHSAHTNTCEAPLRISVVQALAVADKMDWIIQKAVELGAAAVQPIDAERCVLKLAGDRASKRLDHWRQVAVSAAEQCGRSQLCVVHEVHSLSRWLAQAPTGARWILSPDEGLALSAMPRPDTPVSLLIGPEGGWSPHELQAAKAAGCQPVRMGPRILRTETAGLAAIAAMMALWGDF